MRIATLADANLRAAMESALGKNLGKPITVTELPTRTRVNVALSI